MFLSEMLEQAVKTENGQYKINDLEIHSDKCNVDIYIGWHTPSVNIGYYPIVQVDDDEGDMILWKEGTEISADWYRWLEETLEDYLNADDWWFIR